MSAPFTRASLARGAAKAVLGSTTLFTRGDINTRHAPVFNPETTSLFGDVDQSRRNNVIKNSLVLFGLYKDLSVLFPSYVLNPAVGSSIFGASDQAFYLLARNGDKITYHNTQITKLQTLYCGVDSELFAAAVELTSLIKNGANPEDANSYFTRQTGQTYAEPTFSKSDFLKQRWTGTWGEVDGFGTIVPQKGFEVEWDFDAQPLNVDGYGTVDMTVGPKGTTGMCKAIPIGPTLAQIDAAQNISQPMGRLLSEDSDDLTLTCEAASVVLNQAGLTESGTVHGVLPLRVGEVAWKTTRGFSGGSPTAVAALS